MAVGSRDTELVRVILKHRYTKGIDVLFDHKGRLLFEEQVNTIKVTEAGLQKDPTSDGLKRVLRNEKAMLSILREISVSQALLKDDLPFLMKLADLGANLHLPLEDGAYALELIVPQSNPKTYAWLAEHAHAKQKEGSLLIQPLT